VTPLRALVCIGAAAGLGLALGCASAGSEGGPCEGLTPPRLVGAGPAPLPAIYSVIRLGGLVSEEVVVGRDGSLLAVRLAWSPLEMLAPFAQSALERGHFTAAAIEGNPVAVRGLIAVPVGTQSTKHLAPVYDSLRAFVPGGSREARWQLAGSVERLALVAHAGRAAEGTTAIVAIAPGGAEKTLLTLAAAPRPLEVRETVRTGSFFSAPGDYRVELRGGGKPLAFTTVTIAASFETATVNACEPLEGPKKTGPGK
jgi:hypothetical protein